jgi:teichoic acid transport system permease protein
VTSLTRALSTFERAVSKPHARNEWAAETHVYEPHLVGIPPVGQYLREVWRRREFAVELSRTQLRAQHFDTALGQVWLVLNPILLAGVYFVLVDIVRRGNHPPDFFAHLVAGIFAYHYVSGAIRDGVKSVTNGGRLILNSAFPRMLLPLASVVSAFKRFLPTAVIYVPIHLLSGLPVDPTLLWIVPLTLLLTVLASGFTMMAATVQVYFRDLKTFLLDVNPLGQLLTAWSDVIYAGHAPSAQSLAVGSAWAFGAFVTGTLFFMSREREFAVRL